MNRFVLILLLFFISCQETPHSSQPLEFLSQVGYSGTRTICLIIGSDTQAVNDTYNEYYKERIYLYPTLSGYATFLDSVSLEWYLRKYYISKDLEISLNAYMSKNSNQILDSNCSDVYEFTYNAKNGEPALYCMHSLEEATKYYNGLKKIIEESNDDSIQNQLILLDLKLLINKRGFSLSVKQKDMLLGTAKTTEEKEKIQGFLDTLEILDRKKEQNIQD